ncbi:hypothetical protein [uncultured Erythrobacter sp.]|uniref:hypothetical protein n=1 Tax=uncultured Erythrobacter sp. TaxID=263913 RepID=UPI002606E719|nr:hypothetical protein [uncultured Erythrobacter sp.]
MAKVENITIPRGSLLAEFGPAEAYRDCFQCEVPGQVSLTQFIERFYCSVAFRPERIVLGLIGKGANNSDVQELASGAADSFAAWKVIERRDDEILLQDFRGTTASWLSVKPHDKTTTLLFGSWVGQPDRGIVKTLMPFHRWYSRVLLGGVT